MEVKPYAGPIDENSSPNHRCVSRPGVVTRVLNIKADTRHLQQGGKNNGCGAKEQNNSNIKLEDASETP